MLTLMRLTFCATMSEVMESVQRLTNIMSEIATASHEQKNGLEQINQSIAQMDQMTQQNAALVEESASASMALKDQANSLTHAVSIFKIDDGAHAVPRLGRS